MRVSIGCDHRGYQVKCRLLPLLEDLGHQIIDRGTDSSESIDYPDIAALVAGDISTGQADRGILICGTGIGMAIAANKLAGVRATPCNDVFSAEMCRRHNDVNVLCLSGDLLGEGDINKLVEIWINTEFEGGRHARRVDKIGGLES